MKKAVKTRSYHHGNLKEESLKWGLKFLEQGKIDFSMRDIAKKVGVTHGALTRQFGSKSGLLATIAEEGFNKFTEYLIASTKSGTLTEQFFKMGHAYIEFSLKNPHHYKMMLGGKVPNFDCYTGMRKAGQQSFTQLVILIGKMQKENIIKAGDPLIYSYAIWCGLHGTAMLAIERYFNVGPAAKLGPDETVADIPKLASHLIDIQIKNFLEGMKPNR